MAVSASVVPFTPTMPLANDVVAPGDIFSGLAGYTTFGVNQMRACRCIVPKAGTLMDLYVNIGTVSGNVKGAVYDTGDALAGSRTALYSGGSVAAAAGWLKLGDPNIAVTAGQHLDLAVLTDNATVSIARFAAGLSNPVTLPTGFYTAAGGATPKLGWFNSVGAFTPPSAITEANANAGTTGLPFLMARVA